VDDEEPVETVKEAAHLEWARRRFDAIKAAPMRRWRRLAAKDGLVPLVPPESGYSAPSVKVAPQVRRTITRRQDERELDAELDQLREQLKSVDESLLSRRADRQQVPIAVDGTDSSIKLPRPQVQPWRLRLRRAKGVYGSPVWFAEGASSILPSRAATASDFFGRS